MDKYSEKIPLTPVYVGRERRDKPMQRVDEHIHSFYELYFLVDGRIDYFLENRTYHLHPFDMVIVPPGVLHRAILCDDYRHERILVHFDERGVTDRTILDKLVGYKGAITLPNECARQVFKLLNILLSERFNIDEWHDDYAVCLLTELLVSVLRSKYTSQLPYAGIKFEKIIDYVKESCLGEISLSHVAEKFFISDAHLSRLFRKNTGFTFTQYVNYQRIIYAQKLLENKDVSIGEIAMKSGFENLTNFGRVFKQLTGYSPREYRKTIK